MANGNREFRATIGYSYDAAGERAVVQGNERLKRSISGVTNELGELTGAARLAVAATRMRFENTQAELGILREQERLEDAVTASIQQQTAAIEQQASAISRRLAQAERVRATQEQSDSFVGGLRGDLLGDTLSGATGGSRRGGLSERNLGALGQAGRQLFLLPDIAIPGAPGGISTTELSRGMILADAAAQGLGVSVGSLALGLGAAIPIAVGVAAVFGDIQQKLDAARKAAEAFVESQISISQELAGGATSSDIRQRVGELQTGRQVLEETFVTLEGFRAQFEGIARFPAGTREEVDRKLAARNALEAELSELTGGRITNETALREALTRTQEAIQATDGSIADLSVALNTAQIAANDAAEAAQRSAEITIEATKASISQETEFNRLRRTGSVDGIREQIAQNEDLANALNSANERLREQADAAAVAGQTDAWLTLTDQIKANVEEIINLGNANDQLLQSVLPVVEAREREEKAAQALKDQTDEYFEALTNTTKAQQELLDAQQAYNDVLAESDARLVEIAANLAEREAEAAETRAERIEEVEERVGEQRAKRAEDLSKRIAKIERDFARSFTEAVGARDALAAEQAKQRRADALKDLQEGQTEQEKELEVSLQKQLKTIERNYEKQLDAARKAAEKSERQERARRDRELAIAQRAIDQADVQLRNAKNAELAIYQTHFANLNNTANAGLNTLVNTFGQGLLTMVQQIQAAFSRINPTVARAPIQYSSPIGPQRNTIGSGFIPVNSNPFVSANQSFGGSGRTTLNVNFNGASVRQVDVRSRQQATRVLEEFWDQVPLR